MCQHAEKRSFLHMYTRDFCLAKICANEYSHLNVQSITIRFALIKLLFKQKESIMKIKLALLSLIALFIINPLMAVAETGSFPSNGKMLENSIYTNAAVYDNTGVYDGNVGAKANYEDILYSVQAGQYLMHATTTGTDCPAGSYCPGLTNVLYDAENDNGIYACSSLTGGYTLSAARSDADTDCYRNCTAEDTGDVHAATATGTTYYGGTPSTDCSVATCTTGYTASNNACNANTYNIVYGNMTGATNYSGAPTTYTYGTASALSY